MQASGKKECSGCSQTMSLGVLVHVRAFVCHGEHSDGTPYGNCQSLLLPLQIARAGIAGWHHRHVQQVLPHMQSVGVMTERRGLALCFG